MPSLFEFPLSVFPEMKLHSFAFEASAEDADLDNLDDAATLLSGVSVEGEAFRQNDTVHLTLDARVEVEYVCGRCLDPVPGTLTTHFTILYQPAASRPDSLDDEEEVGLGSYEGGIINIRDDLRRHLVLEIPSWPVCREDCAGLCHRCGANLNRETCACADKKGRGERSRLAEQLERLLG